MFKTLYTHDQIDKVSKALDNIVVITNILMRGKIVSMLSSGNVQELLTKLHDHLVKGLLMAHIRIMKDREEIGDLKLFIKDGTIIAAILNIENRVFHGVNALEALEKLHGNNYGYRAILYSFDESILPKEIHGLLEHKGESLEPTSRLPTSAEHYGKGRPTNGTSAVTTKKISPRQLIGSRLAKLGVPLIDVTLSENPRITIIDIVCDEECPIESPMDVIYLAAKAYIDAKKDEDLPGKLKIIVHHKNVCSKTIDLKKEKDAIKIIGMIPEVIWKYSLYIDKYKAKKKGDKLEISLTLKRGELYSTVNLLELVREIYDHIKKEYQGNITLRLKIGVWGMEVRYP